MIDRPQNIYNYDMQHVYNNNWSNVAKARIKTTTVQVQQQLRH